MKRGCHQCTEMSFPTLRSSGLSKVVQLRCGLCPACEDTVNYGTAVRYGMTLQHAFLACVAFSVHRLVVVVVVAMVRLFTGRSTSPTATLHPTRR